MRKAAWTREYDEQWERFEAAKKRLWYKARRHGWRIEKSDPGILWYRDAEFMNVWFDWLDMEVEIEHGRWANWPVMGGYILKKFMGEPQRVSFEDFEKGNFSIQEVL